MINLQPGDSIVVTNVYDRHGDEHSTELEITDVRGRTRTVYVPSEKQEQLRVAFVNDVRLHDDIGVTADKVVIGDGRQWCPVCKLYHRNVGEKTDAGRVTRPCPLLDPTDPRNYG